MARWAAVLAAGLWAAPVSAQLIDEGFESGDLSQWQVIERTGITVSTSPAAAHRGARGLRIVDTETTFEDGMAGGLQKRFSLTSRDVYTRLWFRVVSRGPQNAGGTVFWTAVWERAPGMWSPAHTCLFDYRSDVFCGESDPDLQGGVDSSNTPVGTNVLDGKWRLFEGATLGRGTDAGMALIAVDGVEVLRNEGLHANAGQFPALQLGIVYNYDPDFTAVLDYDDVRLDSAPLPSKLVAAAGPAVEGVCSALEVTLGASMPAPDGGVARGLVAPYPLALVVSGAEVFSDDGCTVEATAPVLDGGALALYLRPPAGGPLEVVVAHGEGDFLPARLTLEVEPASSYYGLRCETSGGGALVLLAVARALAARRRRGAAAGAPPT